MNKIMDLISNLPYELQIYIYEYNPEHRPKLNMVLQDICQLPFRQRMKWVLQDICYQQFCINCDKLIMKEVWSYRNDDLVCCSSECVDEQYFL